MNQIEKLYENAGLLYCNKCRHDSELDCIYMCESKYPPFTAEKQLKLYCYIVDSHNKLVISFAKVPLTIEIFAENLAKSVNDLWQDLTEEERKQIKEILE